PSGRFGANSAWILCAAIAHNLLRAAGVLAGAATAVARGATLRRRIVNIPARLARPQRRPILHLPTHWPWAKTWTTLWHNTIGYSPPAARIRCPLAPRPRPNTTGSAGQTSGYTLPATRSTAKISPKAPHQDRSTD